MAYSTLLGRSGLEVSIESEEQVPTHVVDQVKQTMDDITRLLGNPAGYTQNQRNLELFNLVTKLVRTGKNAAANGSDISVKLAKDKEGLYTRLVEILTKNKRQDLQRKVEEEAATILTQAQPKQEETTASPMRSNGTDIKDSPETNFVTSASARSKWPAANGESGRLSPLSPLSPAAPAISSLPSPPASTISGPSSPEKKAAALKKRKSIETPTPDKRPLKKPTGSAPRKKDPFGSLSFSTPPPRSTSPLKTPKSRISHRTFTNKVVKSTLFNGFYRRFPASSYFQPPGMNSPCDLFQVPHPGGEYNAVRDRFDLYSPRFYKVSGTEKIGLCPICIESVDRGGEGKEVWRPTTSPAYQNHMQIYHGISALTGKPFSPPLVVSMLYEQDEDKKTKMTEGKCHCCSQWIPLQEAQEPSDTENDNGLYVKESLWWTHAARCHRGTNIEGETDIFEEDMVYFTLKTKYQPGSQSPEPEPMEQQQQQHTPNKGKKPRRSASASKINNDTDEGYCYALCKNRGPGMPMIACEDKDCEIEWFHLRCVGLAAPPPGNWYCDACKTRRTATRAERGQRRAGYVRPEIIERAKLLAVQLADKNPGEEVVKV